MHLGGEGLHMLRPTDVRQGRWASAGVVDQGGVHGGWTRSVPFPCLDFTDPCQWQAGRSLTGPAFFRPLQATRFRGAAPLSTCRQPTTLGR